MPIYEYRIAEDAKPCEYCENGFEMIRTLSDPAVEKCPKCQAPVIKLISTSSVGSSKSGLDARAKSAGFHKLQRTGKGEYEKKY